jgi:hypothetical protein
MSTENLESPQTIGGAQYRVSPLETTSAAQAMLAADFLYFGSNPLPCKAVFLRRYLIPGGADNVLGNLRKIVSAETGFC